MKHISSMVRYLVISLIVMLLAAGCATAPVTGRSQLLLVPEQQEMALGLEAYQQILAQEKISQDPQINAMVKRVGSRIAAVSGQTDYNWEFTVDTGRRNCQRLCPSRWKGGGVYRSPSLYEN
ncbi:MAG: hypothetical protein ACOX2W_03815 [Desulfomonilia bacterium]